MYLFPHIKKAPLCLRPIRIAAAAAARTNDTPKGVKTLLACSGAFLLSVNVA